MRRPHDWIYYERMEIELCSRCGFFREDVEQKPCVGRIGTIAKTMGPLLDRLKARDDARKLAAVGLQLNLDGLSVLGFSPDENGAQ